MDITIYEARQIYLSHYLSCKCKLCKLMRNVIKEINELNEEDMKHTTKEYREEEP